MHIKIAVGNLKFFLVILCFAIFWSCQLKKNNESDIVVFCAASVSPVVEQIKILWEKGHNEKIIINAASSGTLARQIENGAMADIFISANAEWMNYLYDVMALKTQPVILAHNQLAVVTPLDSKIESMNFHDFLKVSKGNKRKIAIGDPGHVPVGKYAQESLEYYKMYDELSASFILAKDARSVLRLVELGEAGLGIIYYSDAITSDKVRMLTLIPSESHQKIQYNAVATIEYHLSSWEFLDFMVSDSCKEVWTQHGFVH